MTIEADAGKQLMGLFVKRLLEVLEDPDKRPSSAELEVVRKLLGDNSVTLSSIQRGDFGEIAKKVSEEFPFQNDFEPIGKVVQ